MRRVDDWYPAERHRRRRRLGALSWRALTLAVWFGMCVILGTSVFLWRGRNDLIGTSVPVDGLREEPASSHDASEPEGLRKAKTVLLVGDHSGPVSDENRDIATGERGSHLTDTIMVLRIDPEAGRVTGVNFPRDLLVTLCDGTRQKINAAFHIGGADCLVKTIREFAGIRIDHFVSVDFQGFVDIVDEIGGVTMYLEEPMSDPKAHLDLDKGCVTLDGRDALGFVRTRSKDTDFGRIARQQRFLKELADEATSLDVVANPIRLVNTVNAVSAMLTVDDGMTLGTMRNFVMTMRGVESDDISMATIPTTPDDSGNWFEIPVEPATRNLLRAFKRGALDRFLAQDAESGDQTQKKDDQSAEEVTQVDRVLPQRDYINARPVKDKDC